MRQKLVYPTDEVPHLWAHQKQEKARNPADNLYYRRKTIYSYGGHFPIAKLFERQYGDGVPDTLVLFNNASSSNTTSKHQHLVKGAIPFSYYVIEVPIVAINAKDDNAHIQNVNGLLIKLQELADKQLRARLSDYTNEQRKVALGIIKYCEWFRCKSKVLASKNIRKDRKRILRQLLKDGLLGEFFTNLEEQAKINRAKTNEANKKKREKDYKTLEEWKQGMHDKGAVAHLDTGHSFLRVVEKLMRDVEHENGMTGLSDEFMKKYIQTSKGVELTYRDCETAFVFIQKIRERGIDWRRNGDTLTIDNWQVDSISSQGNIVAGCHRILWNEIERIAKQENWI